MQRKSCENELFGMLELLHIKTKQALQMHHMPNYSFPLAKAKLNSLRLFHTNPQERRKIMSIESLYTLFPNIKS